MKVVLVLIPFGLIAVLCMLFPATHGPASAPPVPAEVVAVPPRPVVDRTPVKGRTAIDQPQHAARKRYVDFVASHLGAIRAELERLWDGGNNPDPRLILMGAEAKEFQSTIDQWYLNPSEETFNRLERQKKVFGENVDRVLGASQ